VERLEQQAAGAAQVQAELQLLRSHVEQLTKDLQAAMVWHMLLCLYGAFRALPFTQKHSV
jgi:hypothetical protein